MAGKALFFLLNKESDFRKGYMDGMRASIEGICAVKGAGQGGIFISRLYDSIEEHTEWHRLTMKRDGEGPFRVEIFASDERYFIYEGRQTDIEEFIKDAGISREDKKQALEPFRRLSFINSADMLLHGVRGRYLWISVEMFWQLDKTTLHDIVIEFPARSIVEYLPEIYRREDKDRFLDRFLGIFQTIYEDVSERIGRTGEKLDMDCGSHTDLNILAGWMGIKTPEVWGEEPLRELLRELVLLYRLRGTRWGMKEILKLYTGTEPYIVEHHEIDSFLEKAGYHEELEALYGSDEDMFTVMLPLSAIDSRLEEKVVRQLIDVMRPAHMAYQLVTLRPYVFAGLHTYLGVNTILSEFQPMKLDGESAVSFAGLMDMNKAGMGADDAGMGADGGIRMGADGAGMYMDDAGMGMDDGIRMGMDGAGMGADGIRMGTGGARMGADGAGMYMDDAGIDMDGGIRMGMDGAGMGADGIRMGTGGARMGMDGTGKTDNDKMQILKKGEEGNRE